MLIKGVHSKCVFVHPETCFFCCFYIGRDAASIIYIVGTFSISDEKLEKLPQLIEKDFYVGPH